MSAPTVRVNNYVENTTKSRYDVLSKIYIISEWLIGINRLPIICKTKRICKILTVGYPLIVNCILLATLLRIYPNSLSKSLTFGNILQYFICSIKGNISLGQLRNFYDKLFIFDEEIRSKWLLSNSSKNNFLQISFMVIFFIIFNVLSRREEDMAYLPSELYPVILTHMIEFYYYGHLLSLLELRLRTIRILLLSSFPLPGKDIRNFSEKQYIDDKDINVINLRNNNSKVEIKKLMKMYKHIIEIYDSLNVAIKWQLLVMLATSFFTTLCMTYYAASEIIINQYTVKNALFDISVISFEITPVIIPCLFCEKIHTEVQQLRASLHTRIFNNVFDKPSRSIAGYFATLTEVRTLSFSVFRMIDLNTSLPFKFVGLVTTYLVILLQFQKVIHLEA
nr:gustatory receptor 15 [Papilio polytes]